MKFKNILIIKLSAIGDVIHALPVASALKKHNPHCRITWVVEKPAYDLLTNNQDIDEIILFEKPKFKTLTGLLHHSPQFSRVLRSRQFDLAIDIQGLFKSAAISLLSGASERIGYCNMREMSYLVSPPVCGVYSQGHVVDRYLDVVRFLGVTVDKVDFPIFIKEEEVEQAENIALNLGINLNKPFAVLAPGTNWPTKCWPIERFSELVDKLWSQGMQSVIIGGPGDKESAMRILRQCRAKAFDLTGKTTLKQLSYIIKKGAVFIGGDTGPMHLAVALGTSVVALFGPTDPKRNGPYHGANRVIQANYPCIKCWKRKCDKNCMDAIEVGAVLAATNSLCNG